MNLFTGGVIKRLVAHTDFGELHVQALICVIFGKQFPHAFGIFYVHNPPIAHS